MGPNGSVLEDLPSIYVSKLLRALIEYKYCAMEKWLTGAPHCNFMDLLKQVENVIQCDKHLLLFWSLGTKCIAHQHIFSAF